LVSVQFSPPCLVKVVFVGMYVRWRAVVKVFPCNVLNLWGCSCGIMLAFY
jgi:hypothetical protein